MHCGAHSPPSGFHPDLMSDLVHIQAVTKCFGSHVAVDAVSLHVRRGEFFSLLGASGCGKSTLLRLIAGFELPDAGEVRVAGRTHHPVPAHVDRVNMVFQNYALFPHMTVAENVGFSLKMQRVPTGAAALRTAAMLEVVRMQSLAHRLPRQLSGGQQQRVALARALVASPDVVLLDEPLGALDLRLREELQIELKRIQRETGSTFIYVTHDQGEALSMSDRIAVMKGGRLEQVGSPQEIYDRPATEAVATFVGEMNVLETAAGRVGLRPEKILITDESSSRVAGTLEEVVYLGAFRRCRVRLDDGRHLILRTHQPVGEPGHRVDLHWMDADMVPLRS